MEIKRIFLVIFVFCCAAISTAQTEFTAKFKAIPAVVPKVKAKPKVAPTSDLPKNTLPDFLNPKPVPNEKYRIDVPKENQISMIPKNDFINPGDVVRDRLNKKQDNFEGIVYRKNQNLGTFKTTSLSARVMYRDAEYVDGDVIRVYLNDKVIQGQVYLDSNFKGFEIVLIKGFNKIDFEALNQGSSGPNTAEFQVYDDKGTLISASQWNLGTGFKATLLLTKE